MASQGWLYCSLQPGLIKLAHTVFRINRSDPDRYVNSINCSIDHKVFNFAIAINCPGISRTSNVLFAEWSCDRIAQNNSNSIHVPGNIKLPLLITIGFVNGISTPNRSGIRKCINIYRIQLRSIASIWSVVVEHGHKNPTRFGLKWCMHDWK